MTNTNERVVDVLKSKHLYLITPRVEKYKIVRNFATLDVTEDVVEKVERKLSGSARPGGSDSRMVRHE